MKLKVILVCIISLLGLNLSAAAESWQGWRGSSGWGMDSDYQKKYDPKKVVMICGTVVGIKKIVPIKGMSPGIALKIKAEKEMFSVHLGPAWYIEKLDYKISAGDKLEVKGGYAFFSDGPSVVAAEIKNGKRFLVLRDNMGTPIWSGWGWKR